MARWRRTSAARVVRRGLAGLAVLGTFAALMGLGFWQLERLEWKEALIAAASSRPDAAPVDAPGPAVWPIDLADWNYRRVRLTGQFGQEEALAWTTINEPNGPYGGMGYFVLSPFTTRDGWSVVVNRGFVPDALAEPEARPADAAAPEGTVTIEGLVRRDDPPNFVTPAADEARGVWFSRHIEPIAAHLGLEGPIAPYNLDLVAAQTPPGGLPQAGESRVAFTNNHLQYALTWFGLALCLVGVVGAWFVRGRSARDAVA